MFSPYRVKHHGEWYRAFTHAFIHKDYMHLFFNMFVLYNFQIVEEAFNYYFDAKGIPLFITFYVGGFLCATIPSLIKHGDNDSYWSLGASGAVSAVVFGFILLAPLEPLYLLFIPIGIPSVIFGALYLGFEYYMDQKGGSNVAHDAHIWGALFGLTFLIILKFDFLKNFIDTIKNAF